MESDSATRKTDHGDRKAYGYYATTKALTYLKTEQNTLDARNDDRKQELLRTYIRKKDTAIRITRTRTS